MQIVIILIISIFQLQIIEIRGQFLKHHKLIAKDNNPIQIQ